MSDSSLNLIHAEPSTGYMLTIIDHYARHARALVRGLTALGGILVVLTSAAISGGEESDEKPTSDVPKFSTEHVEFFSQKVEPLLKQHCHKCHSGAEPKAGLRLDYRGGLLSGGDSGEAVLLDSPGDSLLLEALRYESYEMPPKGKLPAEDIEVFTKWIDMGLPWTEAGLRAPQDEPTAHQPPQVNETTRQHWSFQPIRRPEVPQVHGELAKRVKTPVDAFIFAELQNANLAPNPPAPRQSAARRAYYNLLGLPPTPEEMDQFLSDDSPEAWSRLVDRLLESPHYGEQWGRHWLDLVRYAETNSYERDGAKPFVWRYRDYVIRSFNEDKPYDQFVREQLAGDELDQPTPESIIATGYYRLGIWDDEPADPQQALYDDLDDILSTTGQVFLGLTIGCARCHAHKLDPIPHEDYYQMLAFFTNIQRYGVRGHNTVLDQSVRMVGTDDQVKRYEREIAEWRETLQKVEQQLGQFDKRIRPTLKGGERDDFKHESRRVELARTRVPEVLSEAEFEQYESLTRERDELRKHEPEGLMQVLCVKERGREPQPTHVLIRGNAHAKGEQVEPDFPDVLGFETPTIPAPSDELNSTGRRRVLADWVASERNPLTARVMANRIWQFHFGRGLVRSANDFGMQGERPTHPELLDWLAAELMEGGWKLKRIHKLLMMSSVYQMSSRVHPESYAADPQNNLFWRYNMRRLTAEEIRDSILAVNQNLNRAKMFGPSIYSKIPQAVLQGQSQPGSGWGQSPPEDRYRRSIYIHVKRSLLTPILSSFDFPEPDFTCPVRFVSTQPTQALGMVNSEFANEQAAAFAKELREKVGEDPRGQVRTALRRVLQREPTATEIEYGMELMDTLRRDFQATPEQALNQFCLVALNLNEFLYLD